MKGTEEYAESGMLVQNIFMIEDITHRWKNNRNVISVLRFERLLI